MIRRFRLCRVKSLLSPADRRRSRLWMGTTLIVGALGLGGVVVHAAPVQGANVDVLSGPAAPSFDPSPSKTFVPGERALKSAAAERLTRAGSDPGAGTSRESDP